MSVSPLDEFESEAQSSSAVANPISLADVLALRVPIHWTEAVAAVEELCVALLTDGEPAAIPEAECLVITAQGAVLVRLGAPGTQGVDAVGRMLNAMLDPVTTPIPLRLFVAHSIGSDKYRSLQAFAEGLAYYGRPDRQELVQALYLRCLTSSPSLLEPPDLPPVPVSEPLPVPAEEKAARKRPLPRWLPAAAALLLMLLIPVVLLRNTGTSNVLAPIRGFGASVAAAATTVVDGVKQMVTPSPTVEAKTEAEPIERADAATGRAPRSRTTRAGASAGGGAPPATLPETRAGSSISGASRSEPGAPLEPLVLLPLQPGTLVEGALALPPVLPPVPAPAVRAEDPVVYSSASLDVQPPVIYSPKLPPVPAVDPYWTGTNTMELLIDETGEVLQARLTSRPVRMSDMMLLSPAKTWKFHPALKNGQPVKYRLTMSWVVTPP